MIFSSCGSRFTTPPPGATSVRLDLSGEPDFYLTCRAHLETSDGREVRCEYASGGFWITVAESPGEPSYDGVRVSVDWDGPWWATVHSAQLCRIVGMTINGKTPPLLSMSEMRASAPSNEDRCFDLSGKTSFFEAWLNGTTLETALEAIRAIRALLPHSQIVRYRRHHFDPFHGANVIENLEEVIDDDDRCSALDCLIVAGTPPTQEQLDHVSDVCLLEDVCPDNLILRVQAAVSSASLPSGYEALDAFGPVASRTDDCRRGRIEFLAQYPTGDTVKRKHLEDVSALLNSFLPQYSLECYDLRTGHRYLEKYPRKKRLDPKVVEWVRGAPNRWLETFTSYKDDGTLVRPGLGEIIRQLRSYMGLKNKKRLLGYKPGEIVD